MKVKKNWKRYLELGCLALEIAQLVSNLESLLGQRAGRPVSSQDIIRDFWVQDPVTRCKWRENIVSSAIRRSQAKKKKANTKHLRP
jgi:hypothetical protein